MKYRQQFAILCMIACQAIASVAVSQDTPAYLFRGTQFKAPSAQGTFGQTQRQGMTAKQLEFSDPESLGSKLRRLRETAKTHDSWARPTKYATLCWQPSTAENAGDIKVSGGQRFVCVTSGTTSTTAPSSLSQSGTTDGTVGWIWAGPAITTCDRSMTLITYSNSLVVTLNQFLLAGSNIYGVIGAGTTSGSGTPSSTGANITDGSATLTFFGKYQNPNFPDPDWCDVTYFSTEQLPLVFDDSKALNASIQAVQIISGGSGHAVNDVLPLSGGTASTTGSLRVSSVSAGVITGVTINNAGSYQVLPAATCPQGTSSGSGTGATFAIRWPDPPHAAFYGVYNGGTGTSTGLTRGYTFQAAPNTVPLKQTGAKEFWCDAARLCIRRSGYNNRYTMWINGQRISECPINSGAGSVNYALYDFTSYGGARRRHIRLEYPGTTDIGSVSVDNTGTIWAPYRGDDIRAAFVGDSIESGTAQSAIPGNQVPFRLARALGFSEVVSYIQPSTGWINDAGTPTTAQPFGYRIAEVVSRSPNVVFLKASVNDKSAGYSTASMTTAAQTAMASIRTALPNCLIVTVGCWTCDDTAYAAGRKATDLEAAVFTAVSNRVALNDSLIFKMPFAAPTDGWAPLIRGTWNNSPLSASAVTYTKYIGVDGVHPTDTGNDAYVVWQAEQMDRVVYGVMK